MNYSILIDKNCIQPFGHFEEFYFNPFGELSIQNPAYKNRLNRFFELIKNPNDKINNEIKIDSISKESLEGKNCLIILTRIRPYASIEISLILDFIKGKDNSLLIMSNHNPFEILDNELTSKLGVSLVGGYWSGERGKDTTIDKTLLVDHKILRSQNDENSIKSVVVNTTCRIVSKIGEPFMYLPDTMKGAWSSEDEPQILNKVFGLVLNGQKEKYELVNGKVVILADSGFIGDKDSTFPGLGMIDRGDNELFIKKLILYLLNIE